MLFHIWSFRVVRVFRVGFTVKNPHLLIVLREHLFLLVQSFYSFDRNRFLIMRIHLSYTLLIKMVMEWDVTMGGAYMCC